MRYALTPRRPALTAIAAVMALSATPSIGQVSAPVLPDVTPAPDAPASTTPPAEPTTQAPINPAMTPSASSAAPATPAVTATIPLPSLPTSVAQSAPSVASESPAETAPARVATQAREEARASSRTAAAQTQSAATTARASADTVKAAAATARTATVTETPTPTEPANVDPVVTTPAPIATGAATPPAPVVADNSSVYWMLGGGAAIVILGAGLVATRRRKVPDELSYDETLSERTVVTPAAPVAAPVARAPQDVFVPTPAMAMAQADRETRLERSTVRAAANPAPREGELERMVAEAPSAENPFLTRTKRLRRAQFLLRQAGNGQPQAAPASSTVAAKAPSPQPAASREQVVDFGKLGKGQRINWRPATR